MKKNYTRLCSLALALCMSVASWAIDIVDGVYQVGTAEELVEFADCVMANNGKADAVLTADIDITAYPEFEISSSDVPYTGTFDGQFHTISIAMEKYSEYHALFRKLNGGTIKNLNITGTIHAISKHAAPLVGQLAGADLLENITTAVDINATTIGDGSHAGLIGGVLGGSNCTVNNAIIGGSIKGMETIDCGGVCGWSDGNLTLNNVLLIAEFEIGADNNPSWGNLTFVRHPDFAKLNNCYYLNAFDVVDAAAKKITAEQLASGEACFLLNGSQSENVAFFQNLTGEADAVPVLDATHSVVYLNGRKHCNGDAYADGVFSNTDAGVMQDEHDFQHGACTYCHVVDENYLTPDEDGFYELASAEDLCWFAFMVKNGHGDINGRLTVPVDLQGKDFEPIGSVAVPFRGKFEGNLHPISNLSSMFFGTVNSATIDGVVLQGGVATGNSSYATHTGALAGFLIASTVTRCYTGVTVQNGVGDCGGFFGKVQQTSVIKDCVFAGDIKSGWSAGCIAGSTNGDNSDVTLSNILIDSRNVTYKNGDCHALLIGWFHTGSSKKTSNIWVIEGGELTDIVGAGNRNEQANVLANTHYVSESGSELGGGEVTFALNNGNIVNPVWFQDLSDDSNIPSLDPTQGIVFNITVNGASTYTNDYKVFCANVIDEGEAYLYNLIAYKNDIEAYSDALNAFAASEEWNEELYTAVCDARETLKVSAAAYDKLLEFGEKMAQFLEENADELFGATAEALRAYLEDEVEPDEEQFPNGSLPYIKENMQLTAEQAEAEVEFLNALREAAVKANYKKGDEITNLLVNADLSAAPAWSGWETAFTGSKLATGTAEGVMTTAEFWNSTGYAMQTLTGLKKGVYELRANAATRPGSNTFNANDNYIAYLVANNDEVYVQALTEDMVDDDTAVDGINCHITGDAVDHQLEIDGVTYYVPYGIISAAYAFNGGRYVNRVITNVTDGTLNVGIRMSGSGVANDWMGFGNFRLFYLGATDEAADAMAEGMDNYIARANNLIEYVGTTEMPDPSDTDAPSYKSMPNFSQALRDELQKNISAAESATTTEDKLAACARFTEIFHEIDSCKAAYVEYIALSLTMIDAAYADEKSSDDEIAEMADAVDAVIYGYETGAFTTEEAKEMALLKNTAFYKRYFEGAPAFVNGYYQLASAEDLVWFSNNVNNLGNVTFCAEIVAPIDMTDVEYLPIGTATGAYAGTFKGNLYPVTGLTTMLFGTINGGNIDGVNLQGGVITSSNELYAKHTGSLAGFVNSGTITRCYSNATVSGGLGDIGGIFGKVNTPVVIKNCMFAGNFTAGWSAGSIAGSTDGDNEDVTIADILIDSRNINYKNGDGHGLLVGWLHSGNQKKMSNVWVIEGSELTNIVGYNTDKNYCNAQTTVVTAADAASGKVAYGLNNGETENPVWFQTIGTDEVPTFSPDSKVVLLVDGEYVNAGADDEDAIQALKSESQIVNVYDLGGRMVLQGVDSKTGLRSLPNGLYIIGGRKVMK